MIIYQLIEWHILELVVYVASAKATNLVNPNLGKDGSCVLATFFQREHVEKTAQAWYAKRWVLLTCIFINNNKHSWEPCNGLSGEKMKTLRGTGLHVWYQHGLWWTNRVVHQEDLGNQISTFVQFLHVPGNNQEAQLDSEGNLQYLAIIEPCHVTWIQ